MADHTAIEWTEATWNPITGCSVHSPGCTNCYAMKLAGTRLQHHWSRKGLTQDTKAGPVWTGEVRLNDEWLTQPLTWKRPRRIFVCAHGDLFHESVPDAWIDRVFAVMALCPQHTFQVLTKRSERMREYLEGVADDATRRTRIYALGCRLMAEGNPRRREVPPRFPLPNVWLGVSVEDQARADQRIPDLLATPAAVRWLSCEPLLGPVDLAPKADSTYQLLSEWYGPEGFDETGSQPRRERMEGYFPRLDWIVCGGESGPDARPMHPDWARSLRDQCAAAGIPFFFKQWGEWAPCEARAEGQGVAFHPPQSMRGVHRWRRWDGDTARLPRDDEPAATFLAPGWLAIPVGKSNAGRLLDGVEHNAFPSSPLQQGEPQ